MKLKIPFFKQRTGFYCGPASLEMVLAFFKKYKTQKELAKEARTKKDGTTHEEMIKVARREGFYCYVHNNSTIEEIKHFIKQGLPVIINYKEPSSEEGHYAVISGYKKSRLILNDPWNGNNFKIKEKEFLRRWHDYHKKHEYKNWILVLSRKNLNLGKLFLPTK
ncbi:Peptidase C39 family protein [uncultured archaeon]|nr:Peptidase C39 family protein [uncultured archaeon]